MSEEASRFWVALRAEATRAGVTEHELRTVVGPLSRTASVVAADAHPGGVLLLIGQAGEGKTLAGIRWLMSPLLEPAGWDHDGGTWFPVRHRRRVFRNAKSLCRVHQYDQAEVDALVTPERLVLDDMGQEFLDKAGFLASLVDEVVTERHRRGLPSVMTANLSPKDFSDRYGPRIVDRIAGSGRIVACQAGSLRRRSAAHDVPPALTTEALVARAAECAARRRENDREIGGGS